jgi:hypothetical protein
VAAAGCGGSTDTGAPNYEPHDAGGADSAPDRGSASHPDGGSDAPSVPSADAAEGSDSPSGAQDARDAALEDRRGDDAPRDVASPQADASDAGTDVRVADSSPIDAQPDSPVAIDAAPDGPNVLDAAVADVRDAPPMADGPFLGAGWQDVPTGPASTPPTISAGTNKLVGVFPAQNGIIVVLDTALVVVDRSGAEIRRVTAPRTITAAAFDGKYLGIADGAILTTFLPDLTWVTATTLIEACASAVVVSNSRFVCGPSNDWDRVFYTYDLATSAFLAQSSKYTYNGIPMRIVPGTDDFITVTLDLSPTDFFLYTVGADGKVLFISDSPYHGDFPVTNIYAFDTSPATHLVTHTGLLLKLHAGPGCVPGTGHSSDCLVKDGVLGTLDPGEQFIAMAQDGVGSVMGITGSPTFDAICTGGCKLKRTNVATRLLESTRSYPSTDIGTIVSTYHDSWSNEFLVGYALAATFPAQSAGYRVELVSY